MNEGVNTDSTLVRARLKPQDTPLPPDWLPTRLSTQDSKRDGLNGGGTDPRLLPPS